jgi:hypothetical protein
MAVVHSWPLAANPAGLARLDNHDAELNTWIVAWVAHILPRDPLDLFEAPILHPERHSLAFSEHLLPVLVYNLLIIAGLTLSGWSMYLLMRRWTGSDSAAIVAGLLYAFNAHVLTRFVHLQAHHVEFFPLVLYAFDRVITDPPASLRAGERRRHVLLLAAAFALQSLCSNYLLVFTTYALIAAAAVRWKEINTNNKRFELLVAGLIGVAIVAPFLWPYFQVNREHGLARSADVVTQYNAGWRDYLATGGRLHYAWWSARFYEGRTALFPGFTALALALVTVSSRRMTGDPRVRMTIAFGVVGVALSFGTALPGYAIAHQFLPLLSGLRNVARWGWLPLAAVSILAGFGVSAVEKWRGVPRYIAIAFAVLVTVEAIRTPVGFTPVYDIPRIYDRLAGQPDAVVAEFPFYSGANVSLNGPYVYANTRYFKPLLNGYSSFHPESFEARGRRLASFPGEAALAELRAAGVTHVLVHTPQYTRRYGEKALAAIDTTTQLQFETEDEGIRLYRLK